MAVGIFAIRKVDISIIKISPLLVAAYATMLNTMSIEYPKHIAGNTSPNHLFLRLDRNICKKTAPTRITNRNTILIDVLIIYLPPFEFSYIH